jgi:hypothetical protein
MMMTAPRSPTARRLSLAILALAAATAAATGLAAQSKRPPATDATQGEAPRPRPRPGDPVEFPPRPGRGAEPAPIEAGERNLIILLQTLADTTGQTVVLSGVDSPTEVNLKVAAAIERPDRASIGRVFSASGYSVSQETYRERKVLWVSRDLRPTGQKGAIVRAGQDGGTAAASTESIKPAGGAIRLFRQGEGAATTYLVLYETGSRAEAEDAYQVLQSLVENRRSKAGGAPPQKRPREAPPRER